MKKLLSKYAGLIFFYTTIFLMTILICWNSNLEQQKSTVEEPVQTVQINELN